jgi:hypothetical protein
MWYLQLFIEWANAMLAQDVVFNAVFAFLALWAASGLWPRVSAVLTALVYLVLMMK